MFAKIRVPGHLPNSYQVIVEQLSLCLCPLLKRYLIYLDVAIAPNMSLYLFDHLITCLSGLRPYAKYVLNYTTHLL